MENEGERKINHVWCNPENMQTEHLLDLQEGCLKQLERTKSDLEVISEIIGKRAVENVQTS